MHVLLHWTGLDNASGPQYLFWSGIVGCLATPFVLWRKYSCHAPRCHRIGRHPSADATFVWCAHHHPDIEAGANLAAQHEHHRKVRRFQITGDGRKLLP